MERIVFYNEDTGDIIECLLNPESMTWRRAAGVRNRTLDDLPIVSSAQTDDDLIYTGGGCTEAALELMFDTRASQASSFGSQSDPDNTQQDVRELTIKLWDLAESRPEDTTSSWPPSVRMIWGSWSAPIVVTAVAERLEDFTVDGAPRRSWITLGLRRVNERAELTQQTPVTPLQGDEVEAAVARLTSQDVSIADVPYTASAFSGDLLRIDLLANAAFGNPREWRFLAALNRLENPFRPDPDQSFVTVVTPERGAR
ncbi:hypothetical protein [Parasulfitobacter algicola]|uniref:Contractile injection system tube protein N-terminal domain-containing protein n=1 Tax=Parasulfitobacter algicola TaxID=2614809 RepID=A0ABX2IS82_9RHOB|nr:hypothetical protein [Sulfitobacter algicola]NSX55758.1 hypothetical protein [Sulfitobacter algicola]